MWYLGSYCAYYCSWKWKHQQVFSLTATSATPSSSQAAAASTTTTSNTTSALMSKALSGFGGATKAKTNPIGSAVLAAAAATAAAESKQEQVSEPVTSNARTTATGITNQSNNHEYVLLFSLKKILQSEQLTSYNDFQRLMNTVLYFKDATNWQWIHATFHFDFGFLMLC